MALDFMEHLEQQHGEAGELDAIAFIAAVGFAYLALATPQRRQQASSLEE